MSHLSSHRIEIDYDDLKVFWISDLPEHTNVLYTLADYIAATVKSAMIVTIAKHVVATSAVFIPVTGTDRGSWAGTPEDDRPC
jgi:hypothetical protein